MEAPRGIILLEGADSSGKSTLARFFIENYGAAYMHGSVHHDFWHRHLVMLRRAVRLSQQRLVIIDRHWLSHLVYGAAFGNKQYDAAARGFDRVLRRYGALYVLCSPKNQARQAERWATDRATGKHEHYDSVRDVIRIYADLRDGCIAHPGDGYLDQLIRYQDFCQRDDVIVYDMDNHIGPNTMKSFVGNVLKKLRMLRENMLPAQGENLSGRWPQNSSHRYLVVDAAPPNMPKGYPRWPFIARDDDQPNPWAWVNRATNLVYAKEDNFVYTSAFSPYGDKIWLNELIPQATRVIAIGEFAATKIKEKGIYPVEIPHPTKYFRKSLDIDGYTKLLGSAIA